MSEPHKVIEPVSVKKIKDLLERSDPWAVGELQRLAIGFRIATMETDHASIRRMLKQFLEQTDPLARPVQNTDVSRCEDYSDDRPGFDPLDADDDDWQHI